MTEIKPDRRFPVSDNLAVGARGGIIAFGLKISSTVLGFLNQILLARILGAGGVGEVILAVTVVRISAQIAKFGMEETMMKFVPLYIDKDDKSLLKGAIFFAIKFCLFFSTVFMLLVLFLSKYIAVDIFHSTGLLKLMPVVVIAIPAWVIRDVVGGVLRGYKDALKALIPESLISPFSRLAVFLLLLMGGATPLDAIIAFAAGELFAVAVAVIFLQRRLKILKSVKAKYERGKILDVAYTIIFTSMSVILYTQADIWILGMFESTETVGIYGVAAKLVLLVYFPMVGFAAIIPPLISSIYTSRDIAELRRVVRESTRWILSLAMPIILILMLEGKLILKFAYGAEFAAGYAVLLILTVGQMVKAGAGLIGILLQMTGYHKTYMKINIIGGMLNIIMNIILVPRFGMIGAASATALCLSSIDIICIIVVYKRLAVVSLAKGLRFDLIFIMSVVSAYLLVMYSGFYMGPHIILAAALVIYLSKSVYAHDIPWRLLLPRGRGDGICDL